MAHPKPESKYGPVAPRLPGGFAPLPLEAAWRDWPRRPRACERRGQRCRVGKAAVRLAWPVGRMAAGRWPTDYANGGQHQPGGGCRRTGWGRGRLVGRLRERGVTGPAARRQARQQAQATKYSVKKAAHSSEEKTAVGPATTRPRLNSRQARKLPPASQGYFAPGLTFLLGIERK